MATGDITAVEVTATGEPYGAHADIEVEGFSTGMTIDFGSGRGSALDKADLASATFVLTVVSEGYDDTGTLGTVTRTLYATEIVRQESPNEASNEESSTAGGAKIRVALSDFVYDDDKDGGAGTSGTDPTVDIAAGAIRNDGGSNELNNAATSATVTNNSGLDYPQALARWDRVQGVMHLDRVTGGFKLAAKADHRDGIAAVRFDADGQSSSHNQNETVTSPTKVQRSGSGLYEQAYETAALPISGFTQGEAIDLRFRAYPVVGDADSVLDTSGNTAVADYVLGYNTHTLKCDKTGALETIKYVSTTGNDSTGDGSSGNPYASISKAADDGANRVLLKAGTHELTGVAMTRANWPTDEWVVIEPESGEDETTAIVKMSTVNRNDGGRYTHFKGVGLDVQDSGAWYGHSFTDELVRCTACNFTDSAGSSSTIAFRDVFGIFIDNCTGKMWSDGWRFESSGSDGGAYCFDGNDWGVVSGTPGKVQGVFEFCANRYQGDGSSNSWDWQFFTTPDATIADVDNFFFRFNRLTSGTTGWAWDGAISHGASIVGNVIERSAGATSNVNLWVETQTEHVVFAHNTIQGGQVGIAYNSTGSTSVPHRNWRAVGNAIGDYATKHDTFGTADGARTGGWPIMYGVGWLDNHLGENIAAGGFEYPGVGVTTGSASQGYTDDQSVEDGASGEGDYTPDTGSALLDRIDADDQRIAADLDGTDLADPADVGAVQVSDATAPAVSNFTATHTAPGRDIDISFDTDEQAAVVSIGISGTESDTLTLAAMEVSETDNMDGTYTYTATYSASSDGSFTVTLTTVEDAAGNNGGGQSTNLDVDTTAPVPSSDETTNTVADSYEMTFDENVSLGADPASKTVFFRDATDGRTLELAMNDARVSIVSSLRLRVDLDTTTLDPVYTDSHVYVSLSAGAVVNASGIGNAEVASRPLDSNTSTTMRPSGMTPTKQRAVRHAGVLRRKVFWRR